MIPTHVPRRSFRPTDEDHANLAELAGALRSARSRPFVNPSDTIRDALRAATALARTGGLENALRVYRDQLAGRG